MKTAADHFHEHLDSCQQCERNPFDLCGAGAVLMLAVGQTIGVGPW